MSMGDFIVDFIREMWFFVLLFILIGLVYIIVAVDKRRVAAEERRVAAMTPEQRAAYEKVAKTMNLLELRAQEAQKAERAESLHGALNPTMMCPHCQTKGSIRTKVVDRKKGISGGKATAALLTGGISMLATGLSRKEHATQAYCENCWNSWDF